MLEFIGMPEKLSVDLSTDYFCHQSFSPDENQTVTRKKTGAHGQN